MRSGLKAPAFGFIWLSAALAAPASAAPAAAAGGCGSPGAIGVSRTVEIDTKGGPGFGFEHYKAYDFLQAKEVVLTFDDGPQKFSTEMVLQALAEHCTKAIFFSIGKMALGYPEIIREVAKAGHTIGTHTWSHQSARKLKTFEEAKDEIERGASGVKRALGGAGVAPFFRFPALEDTPETLKYLADRNIAIWSTDIDSFDFKPQLPEHLVKSVMAKLEKRGKGIILMHDIHKTTAKAVPLLLAELKANGYKIVHVKAKSELQTLAEYDAAIDKNAKGLPAAGTERPASSVFHTIDGTPPPEESAPAPAHAADAPKPVAPAPAPTAPAVTPPPAAPAAPANKAEAPKTDAAPSQSAAATTAPSSPVTTVPAASPSTATASIKTAEDDPMPPASSRPVSSAPNTDASHAASPPAAGAAPPSKSISERAKEIWELWFGK